MTIVLKPLWLELRGFAAQAGGSPAAGNVGLGITECLSGSLEQE